MIRFFCSVMIPSSLPDDFQHRHLFIGSHPSVDPFEKPCSADAEQPGAWLTDVDAAVADAVGTVSGGDCPQGFLGSGSLEGQVGRADDQFLQFVFRSPCPQLIVALGQLAHGALQGGAQPTVAHIEDAVGGPLLRQAPSQSDGFCCLIHDFSCFSFVLLDGRGLHDLHDLMTS